VRVILRGVEGSAAEIVSEDLTDDQSAKDLDEIKRAMSIGQKTPFYPNVKWLSVAHKDLMAAHLLPPSARANGKSNGKG
jgi:hypothetical protein